MSWPVGARCAPLCLQHRIELKSKESVVQQGRKYGNFYHVEPDIPLDGRKVIRELNDSLGIRVAPEVVKSTTERVCDQFDRGLWSIAEISCALGTSIRTMQRRLDDEGRSFGIIRDTYRFRTAILTLSDSAYPISLICTELGFTDRTSFNLAVKRWTGRTPKEFRRVLLMQSGEPGYGSAPNDLRGL